MTPTSLTARREPLPGGGHALAYPWDGEEVLIRDDAMTVLRCIEVLSDRDTPNEERGRTFCELIFADLADAFLACDYDPRELARLADAVAWDVCGIDLSGTRPCEEPVWDPVEDADRIRTSFRQAYGIDWDEERGHVSFAEFVALVGGCPRDTPLGRAIWYRSPATRPKQTKHNKQEVEEWQRLHKAYALNRRRSSPGKDTGDAAMRDAFAALRRAAR